MITCPNKNLDSWKNLVYARGETISYFLWNKFKGNVPESEYSNNNVNALPKAVKIILNNIKKIDNWYKTIKDKTIFWNKLGTDLQIPKEQIELLKSIEGNSIEEILMNFAANYSYTVEINTATTKIAQTSSRRDEFQFTVDNNYYTSFDSLVTDKKVYQKNNTNISKEEYDSARLKHIKLYDETLKIELTQHYSNLTVPGGTNYTENEIATPAITPSIKGHAQFSTDNGIGWFRSDDKENKIIGWKEEDDFLNSETAQYNPITKDDKIIFGHPTIGKSYLKQKGNNNFITLDDDYANEVNAFIDSNRGSETRQEYKGRKPQEYNEFMLNLFDKLKVQAKKEGKRLFVSNTNILKERMSEFDKVITIPKDEFKKRFDARGATYGFEDWKSDIDATIAKVDKSKVISTTGYLSDLLKGNPKTRRILEVQSDLFQKGRDKQELTIRPDDFTENELFYGKEKVKFDIGTKEEGYNETYQDSDNYYILVNNKLAKISKKRFNEIEDNYENLLLPKNEFTIIEDFIKTTSNKNKFLQLLNKDNNWVTFFVKSIIQDSAKKGYEKVLFPTGNTASKVEGHTTLEQFKKQKEDRIKELEELKGRNIKANERAVSPFLTSNSFEIEQNRIENEITQLKQELERVETEGFGALKPIFAFYENQVRRILEKTDNPKPITDEYGNTWIEVDLMDNQTKKNVETVFYQKDSSIELELLATDYFAKRNGKIYIKKNFGIEARNLINKQFKEFVKIQKEKVKGQLGRNIEFVTITPQGSLFQKEGQGNVDEELNSLMEDYIRRAGFTLSMKDEVLSNLGEQVSAVTKVTKVKNGFIKLVEVAKGKMKKNTLPEEAAHIVVALAMNNPLMEKLIDQISETSYYASVKEQYSQDYASDRQIRIEAVGQLIRDHIIKENAKTKSSLLKLIETIWKWLTGKLTKVDELALNTEWNQIARKYAKDVLIGDVSGEITEEFFNYQKFEDDFDFDMGDWVIMDKKPLPSAVQNYIEHAQNTAAFLKRQLHSAHKENNAKINSQIEKLNNRVQELSKVKTGVFSLLVNYAKEDIKQIAENLNKFATLENKERYYHVAMSNLSAWTNLDTLVISGDKEIDKDVAELASNARKLKVKVEEAYIAYTNTKGKEFTQEDFYMAHSDTGGAEALHMSIASSKIPELRYAYRIVEKAGYFADQAHKAFVTEKRGIEKEWEQWYKSRGLTRQQAIEIFLQKDKDGKLTGNFIHEVSQDFYEAKKAKRKEYEKNAPLYYKWLNRNTVKVVDEERWGYAQENAKAEFTENGVLNQAKYDRWFKEHDPHKKQIDFAKTKEYVSTEPNPLLWKDKRFEVIEKDAQLKRFYDYVIGHFEDRKAVMPYSKGSSNYLPEMKSGFSMVELGTQTLDKALLGLKNYFTVEVKAPEHYNPTSVTGEQIKGIPVYMMSDTLSPETKEKDFWKVLEVFDAVSRTYEYRYKVEPMVLLIKDLFKQAKESQLTPDGVPITSKITGKVQELLNANKNTLEALSYFMDSRFYDDTKEEYDRVTTIEAKLDADGKIISEARGISLAHFGDILASWTRRKAMGLNLFAGAVNAIFGTQTVLLHAAGEQDFTPNQVIQAFGIAMNLGAVGTPLYRKLYHLASKYAIFNDYSEIADMKSKLDKGLFFFNEQTERFIRSLSMVAKMLNTKVTVDGKEMSLWEAHGSDGQNEVYTADQEYAFSSHLNALNDKLQGNYRDATLANKNVLWRLAMVFRKWLPEAINARIGAERVDERFTDGRLQKGRLRTFMNALGDSKKVSKEGVSKGYVIGEFGKEILKQFGNAFFLGKGMITTETFKELNEIDKVNMKKNAAALRMTITVYLIGLLLAGLDSDDDDERLRLLHFAISSTYKLQGDMSFFLSPSQMTYMTHNVLPVATTFDDLGRFFSAIPRAIGGNDEIEGGPYDGQSNLGRQFLKALPISSQALKWIDLPNLNLKGR